jgi:RNA polymerase sigma-70 factor (ECF subfamily)
VKKTATRFFTPRLVVSKDPPARGENTRRFRQEILPHLDGAYNLARYLTRDPMLSEDIVQDAFVRAFQAFGQFRGDSPRAWLFAIVRNCCRTAMSAAGSSTMLRESDLAQGDADELLNQPDPRPSPEDSAVSNDEIAGLRRAIEAVPEPFREAIVLREMEGLSYAEIAEVAGVAIGTVMSRLSRGRAILTEVLLPAEESGSESNEESSGSAT